LASSYTTRECFDGRRGLAAKDLACGTTRRIVPNRRRENRAALQPAERTPPSDPINS